MSTYKTSNCLIDYATSKHKSIPTDYPPFSLERLHERELAIKMGRLRVAQKSRNNKASSNCKLKTFREFDKLATAYSRKITEFFNLYRGFSNKFNITVVRSDDKLHHVFKEVMQIKDEMQKYIYCVDLLQTQLNESPKRIFRKNMDVFTLESVSVLLVEGGVRNMGSSFVRGELEEVFGWEFEVSEQLRVRMTRILQKELTQAYMLAS